MPALLYFLCQLCCALANAKKSHGDLAEGAHFTQFIRCPGTKVQILTQLLAKELKNAQRVRREACFSVYLLYWYNSTNNDADIRQQSSRTRKHVRRAVYRSSKGASSSSKRKWQMASSEVGTSVCGLKILVYAALSYKCMRPYATCA